MSDGKPGRVSPTRRFDSAAFAGSGHSKDARYQLFGTRTARCMSLASNGLPSVVSAPETTQLLLPTTGSPWSTPNAQLPTPNPEFPSPKKGDITVRTWELEVGR